MKESIDVKKTLAKKAEVSHDTIAKTEKILAKADEETKAELRAGNISINKAYQDIKRVENREKRVSKIAEISKENVELKTDKKFPVIYADPPWQYEHSKTDSRMIENQYPTMTLDNICDLQIPSADDCILFLWTTAPKLQEGFKVLNKWGFNYRSCAIWDKQKMGMGYYFRIQHEILLIGTKGNIPVPQPADRKRSVFSIPYQGHSSKPVDFIETIEGMYPEFEKLEMFCREPRDGWHVWGNQSNAA